jgi:FkbM family methyltransferase
VASRQSWFGLKQHIKRFLSLRIPHAVLRGLVRVFPSLRSGRWPAPAGLQEVTARANDGSFVMLSPHRCEIAKELYWGQGRRPKPEDALALDIVARLARDADEFLDVGAYTGVFSLATTASAPALHAHAFEIVPAAADLLESNARRNHVADRVTVHRVGLGNPETKMRVPSGEGGSALPSFYSTRMTFSEGSMVDFVSLDSIGSSLDPNADVVMKIDVEGTEDDVFAFGQEFLRTFHPDILCEVLDGIADGPKLERLLAPGGYRFYLVGERGVLPVDHLIPDARFRDWLFTRREPQDLQALRIPVMHRRSEGTPAPTSA